MLDFFPLILLLVFIGLGIPIGYALIISGTLGLLMFFPISQTGILIAANTRGTLSSFLLSAVPMFILMAYFLKESGMVKKLIDAVNAWLGHLRGGLPATVTISNGFMAALSGSSVAAAGAMAAASVPEMKRLGYSDRLSMGTVTASGTFATMIPPSLGLIIFGIITGESIGALFLGGMIPGLLTVVAYIATISLWIRFYPEAAGGSFEKASFGERFDHLKSVIPGLLLIVVVLGGLYSGTMTPGESGAVGAFGAMIIALSYGDNPKIENAHTAIQNTLNISVMIFIILIGGNIFAQYMNILGLSDMLLDTVTGLGVEGLTIILLFLLLYIFLGMFMSIEAVMIVTLPVIMPIVTELGFSPIWFGVLIAKTIEIGLVTPPLGMNVYVASGVVDIDVNTTFSGAIRFIAADLAVLALMILLPEIVLYLPNHFGP